MPIVWDKGRFETGIDVIDGQHKRIVGYLNDLEIAIERKDRAAVGGVLEELVDPRSRILLLKRH